MKVLYVAGALIVLAFCLLLQKKDNYRLTSGAINQTFDIIIVGAGTAGCILARRLADLGNVSVLLVDAGPELLPWQKYLSNTPLLGTLLLGSSIDWSYTTVPQKHAARLLNKKQIVIPSGRMLGGTSMFNSLIVSRGHPDDYENWNLTEWNFEIMKPFLEYNNLTRKEPFEFHPIANQLSAAVSNLSRCHSVRTNNEGGWAEPGCWRPLFSINDKSERLTTLNVYLDQLIVKKSSNLKILTNAFVEKVLVTKQSMLTTGILIKDQGKFLPLKVSQHGQVILSAGAIGSPKILIKSGIGSKEHLNKLKIPILRDLSVGDNLQDHVMFGVFVTTNTTIGINSMDILNPVQILKYMFTRTGLWSHPSLVTNVMYIQTPIQIKSGKSSPDIQICVCALSELNSQLQKITNFRDDTWATFTPPRNITSGFFLSIFLLHPRSRGTIRLSPISQRPLIDPKYLSHREDLIRLRQGLRMAIDMIESPHSAVFQAMNAQVYLPSYPECAHLRRQSDAHLECLIRGTANTGFHLVGSNKMAEFSDSSGVVLPNLSVKGISNLRVVDASILPTVPSGNTNIPIAAVAERAANIISDNMRDKCDS